MVMCNLLKAFRLSVKIRATITYIRYICNGATYKCCCHSGTHISMFFQITLVDSLVCALYTISQELRQCLIPYLLILCYLRQDIIDNRLNGHTAGILTICVTSHTIGHYKETVFLG